MSKLFLCVFLLTSVQNLCARTGKEAFKEAVSSYIKGEKSESIALMDEARGIEPSDEEIRNFYLKILTEYGSESFFEKKYGEALNYLNKAAKIDPSNAEINKMLLLCGQATGDVPEKNRERVIESELVKEFKREQQKFTSSYNYGVNTIDMLLKQSEKERAELVNLINKQQREDSAKINRVIMGSVFVIMLLGFGTAFITQRFMHNLAAKREDALFEHQKRILEEMRKGGVYHTALPPLVRNSTHEVITDIDPIIREKARRIELIERELASEVDPNVATTLLLPYLDDTSNRVRANAAKALFSHNKKLAMATLKSMLMSYNKWMRTSAVWVLAELATEETMELLEGVTDDKKESVLSQLKDSLKRIIERPETDKKIKGKAEKILKCTEERIKEVKNVKLQNGFN